jgi:flavodoxin
MRALVIHESLYGNTRTIAEAITEGLAEARPDVAVRCLPAAEVVGPPAIPLGDVDLLVVGCPTHAWGMSSVRSRSAQLAKDGRETPERTHDPDASGPGVRELLPLVAGATPGIRAAAFDTRLDSRFAGGAAKRLARALRKAGAVPVGRPTGFVVTGMTGPLRDGERERARAWGRELAAVLAAPAQDRSLR